MISEWSIVTFLVTMPLVFGGATWFYRELDLSRTAFLAFQGARREMILTHQETKFRVQIGHQSEVISLAPLESLDQGSLGLTPSDLGAEGSRLLADASRSSHQLQELASISLPVTSKPGQDPKLP
jgi:hypothetical protein